MPRIGKSSRDLTFSTAPLDRRAERRDEDGLVAGLLQDPLTRVVEVHGDRAEVRIEESGSPSLVTRPPRAGDGDGLVLYLGVRASDPAAGDHGAVPAPAKGDPTADGEGPAYLAVARSADDEPGGEWRTLRQVGAALGPVDAALWVTSQGVLNWHATHGFCPRCGRRTEVVKAGWVRRCPADDSLHFPRTDPAVIMAVTDDDDRLLLARGRGFNSIGMSVLAGFVEPGETLAAAVAREVWEEVGLEVTRVTYLGDQPWPFPSSLMIGFRAQVHGGQVRMQESEIEAVRWFSRGGLLAAIGAGELAISGRLSISRSLIEDWFGGPIDSPEVRLRAR